MSRKSKTPLLRGVHVGLGAGGVALLAYMVRAIGPETLKANLLAFGLGPTVLLILLYGSAQLCFGGAWFALLKTRSESIGFWETFLAYAAGDALNMTVPSANLAGEPVKIMLIRDKISLASALSSVTVYKYSDILSMTAFLALGWLCHFPFYRLPLSWNVGAGVVVGGMAALCFFLYLLQRRGIYHPTGRWLERLGLVWVVDKLKSAHLIDQEIHGFYRDHPRAFALSFLLNFIAWFGGVVEIWLFMKLSGLPPSFSAALTIETFSLFINNVIFFVPGRLGVGEGGRVLLFMSLGYPTSLGLTYGIIRRLRELAWVGAGLGVLLSRKASHPEVMTPAPQSQPSDRIGTQ